jgi:hypothetical protein
MSLPVDRWPTVQRALELMLEDLAGAASISCARMIDHMSEQTLIAPSSATLHRLATASPPRHTRAAVPITGTAAERLARPFCRLNPHLMITRDLSIASGDSSIPVPTVYYWRRGPHDADFKELGTGGFLLPRHEDTGDHYAATSNARLPDHIAYHHARSPLYLFHAWAWARQRWAALLVAEGLQSCPFAFKLGRNIPPENLLGRQFGDFCDDPILNELWEPGWLLAMQLRFARCRIGLSPAIRRSRSQGGYIVLPVPASRTADQYSVGAPMRQVIWDEVLLRGGTAADFERMETHARFLNEGRRKATDHNRLSQTQG